MKKILVVTMALSFIIALCGCAPEKTEGKGNSDLKQVVSIYTEAVYKDDYSAYINLIPDFCKRNIAKSFGLGGDVTDAEIIQEMEKQLEKNKQTIEILSISVLSQEEVNDFSQYDDFNKTFNGTVTVDDYQQIEEIAKVRADIKLIISEEEEVVGRETTCVKVDNRWLIAFSKVITE